MLTLESIIYSHNSGMNLHPFPKFKIHRAILTFTIHKVGITQEVIVCGTSVKFLPNCFLLVASTCHHKNSLRYNLSRMSSCPNNDFSSLAILATVLYLECALHSIFSSLLELFASMRHSQEAHVELLVCDILSQKRFIELPMLTNVFPPFASSFLYVVTTSFAPTRFLSHSFTISHLRILGMYCYLVLMLPGGDFTCSPGVFSLQSALYS